MEIVRPLPPPVLFLSFPYLLVFDTRPHPPPSSLLLCFSCNSHPRLFLFQMTAIHTSLSSKPFAAQNVFHHYKDEVHGFAGARADFKNERDAKAFRGAYVEAARFFDGVMV